MLNPNEARPQCAVSGKLKDGMCAAIIYRTMTCGANGFCKHQKAIVQPATANWPYDDMGTPVEVQS